MSNLPFEEIEENTADILDLNQSEDNFSDCNAKYSFNNVPEIEYNYSENIYSS